MKKMVCLLTVLYLYEAKAQEPITSIPFSCFGDHVLIKVSIDDSQPLDFVFDTGSGLTMVDEDVVENLNLEKKKIIMKDVDHDVYLTKHNTLAINGFLMEKDIKVYSTDLNHLEISLGKDIDGILGYDLLHHHSVILNYDNMTMNIYDHGNVPKTGDAIPFDLYITIPVIQGVVVLNNGESYEGEFFIMTGAGTTMDFSAPFARKNDVINKTGKHFSYYVKSISNEETIHYEGHIESIYFGQQKIDDLPIGISDAKSGIQADPKTIGIIGNQILSKYNITIDVPDKMIYLTKNTKWEEPFQVNSAGIDVQLSKDKKKILVHQVFENSPAEEAGIALNDELVEVNGTSINDMTMVDVKNIFKKEGETLQLTVNRDGVQKKVSITLRSLID